MTDWMEWNRELEKKAFAKLAIMATRWRDDPVEEIKQIPENMSAAGRNVAAETLGLMGDIDPMLGPGGMPGEVFQGIERDRLMPNSEELIDKFGEREHWSHIPAMLAAPGPGEVVTGAKVALKTLLGLGKEASAGAILAQSLFHGTPHKFSKFDLKAIGTGEGAQAYGHGLYFAENPKVAGSYKTTPGVSTIHAKELEELRKQRNHLTIKRQSPQTVQEELINDTQIKEFDDLINQKQIELQESMNPPGHLYEVDLPDETIAKMLDWDAPLSEQPDNIASKVADAIGGRSGRDHKNKRFFFEVQSQDNNVIGRLQGDATLNRIIGYGDNMDAAKADAVSKLNGSDAVHALESKHGQEGASAILNEAGIPGIRFFDGSSRAKGEGTRNIVPFTPDIITSVKRDGELVYKTGKKLDDIIELIDKY